MEQELLDRMAALLADMRDAKPENRSELARRYAVTITDLEKVYAYFMTFVCEKKA
jgi:hypothetical protein